MSCAGRRRLTFMLAVGSACATGSASAVPADVVIDARSWRVIAEKSGPVSYYDVATDAGRTFVRARYRPPLETVVLGWQASDELRQTARRVRWEWRARTLPVAGNDCVRGKGDSAAAAYLTWKRGLKYYVLKYVWSGAGEQGRRCVRRRSLFVAEATARRLGACGRRSARRVPQALRERRSPGFGPGLRRHGDRHRW
jgi:hypothetical protein